MKLEDVAIAAMRRRNRVIEKANERITSLLESNAWEVKAEEGIYGVTITKRRKGVPAGRGYESNWNSEIIPWEDGRP